MISALMEYTEDLTVTSAFDGEHMPNSRHYRGEALDLRSHNMTKAKKVKFQAWVTETLGPKFTVLLENPGQVNEHFHIQVRKGIRFP